MFGIGLPELLLIMVVALIVIGPDKLPDMAKTLGKTLFEFKKVIDGVKTSIDEGQETHNKAENVEKEAPAKKSLSDKEEELMKDYNDVTLEESEKKKNIS